MVRQGLGTRLLRLTTLDPGKFRGLPCTVAISKVSRVALEEEVEYFMILLC